MKGKDNAELSAVYIALAIAIVLRAWGRFNPLLSFVAKATK